MTKFGQVIHYDPETQTATVQYARPEACEKCGACSGGRTREGQITLKAECKAGDWVKVELPDGKFLHATAIAYLFPLALFFIGLLAGYALSDQNELIALISSMATLGISLGILKLNERRIAGRPEWSPKVTQVYAAKPEIDDIGCGSRE